jgi:hypothetical protein
MAKTFYILGEINPKHPNEPKIVIGRGILGEASEAVHAEDVRLRRMISFSANSFIPGTTGVINAAGTGLVIVSRLSPRMAAVVNYASITPAPRNFASLIVNRGSLNGTNLGGATRNGSIAFSFMAIGD